MSIPEPDPRPVTSSDSKARVTERLGGMRVLEGDLARAALREGGRRVSGTPLFTQAIRSDPNCRVQCGVALQWAGALIRCDIRSGPLHERS